MLALCRTQDASSHSGRQTLITRLAAKGGGGARLLQELAGHANLATTQRYIDVNGQQMRAVIEFL